MRKKLAPPSGGLGSSGRKGLGGAARRQAPSAPQAGNRRPRPKRAPREQGPEGDAMASGEAAPISESNAPLRAVAEVARSAGGAKAVAPARRVVRRASFIMVPRY